MPSLDDLENIDDSITPEEVMQVVEAKDLYEKIVLQDLFDQAVKTPPNLRHHAFEARIGFDDPSSDELKRGLGWIASNIKLATLLRLVRDGFLLDCEVAPDKTEDYSTIVVKYHPENFLAWYEKFLGFKISDVPFFDEEKSIIFFRTNKCEIPKGTVLHYFCKKMFEAGPGKKVEETDIARAVDWEKAGAKELRRTIYDAMRSVNTRVANELLIKELFKWKNSYCWFNEKLFKKQ